MNSNTLQFINQLIILMMFLNERFGQIPFHFVIIMRHYFYFMCVCVNTQHACHDIWVQVQGQPLVSTSALFRWDRVSLVVSPCMYKTSWPTSPRNFPLGGASVVTQIKGYNARLAGVCYIGGFSLGSGGFKHSSSLLLGKYFTLWAISSAQRPLYQCTACSYNGALGPLVYVKVRSGPDLRASLSRETSTLRDM